MSDEDRVTIRAAHKFTPSAAMQGRGGMSLCQCSLLLGDAIHRTDPPTESERRALKEVLQANFMETRSLNEEISAILEARSRRPQPHERERSMICDRCRGAGVLRYDLEPGGAIHTESCWKCDGSGVLNPQPNDSCQTCGEPITRDERGTWRHADGSIFCPQTTVSGHGDEGK